MPLPTTVTVPQLFRLVGLPDSPAVVDVRIDDDFAADPRLIPGTVRRDFRTVASWAAEFAGQSVVVACQRGLTLSQGVAAWLRHAGADAESLEGGFEAWRDAGGLLVNAERLPSRNAHGHTVWVTRARPNLSASAGPDAGISGRRRLARRAGGVGLPHRGRGDE